MLRLLKKETECSMTVKEIAELAHVSPATVSNVINHRNNVGEKTRQPQNCQTTFGISI